MMMINTPVKSEGLNWFMARLQLNQAWLLPLSLVAITLLLFANGLGQEFIWEDIPLIQQNYLVQHAGHLPQLLLRDLWAFSEEPGQPHHLYRPLLSLSFLLDFHLWGFYPPGYHLTNLLLHALVVVTVYFLVELILQQRGLAWLGAFLFAIHPIHTEAVTWISGRADLLCGLFFFLAFWLYLRSSHQEHPGYWIGSLTALFLALLSKEIALTFPFIILLYNLCLAQSSHSEQANGRRRISLGQAVIEALPYLVIIIIYLTLRLWVLGFFISSQERTFMTLSYDFSELASTLFLAAKITALYAWLLLIPFPLNAHRLITDIAATSGFIGWLSLLLVGVLLISSLMAVRRAPKYAFAGLFFLVIILPAAGLLTLGEFIPERMLYIPSLVMCLVLALLSAALRQRRPTVGTILLVLIIIPWLVFTYRRNIDWQDNLTFWTQTVAISPRSVSARNHLGQELWYEGQFEPAVAQFEQALQLDAENTEAYTGLGHVYFSQEEFETARTYYQQASQLAPDNPWSHLNLGLASEGLGDAEKALAAYRQALTLDARFAPAYYQLGLLYSRLGNIAEATVYLEQFLDLEPRSALAHNHLGLLYLDQELFAQAISEFEQAAQLEPNSAEILNNLGLAHMQAGQTKKATQLLEQATQLKSDYAPAHFNLGLAYLQSEARDKALRAFATAAELDPTNEEVKRLIKELSNQ